MQPASANNSTAASAKRKPCGGYECQATSTRRAKAPFQKPHYRRCVKETTGYIVEQHVGVVYHDGTAYALKWLARKDNDGGKLLDTVAVLKERAQRQGGTYGGISTFGAKFVGGGPGQSDAQREALSDNCW